MTTLRRLATTPPPALVRGWWAEILTGTVLLGGLAAHLGGAG